MTRRRLFQDEIENPVSPFIDVVVNAMGAMVIILIVYMLMVQPRPVPEELRIITEQLPHAAWFEGYEAFVTAQGGEGAYTFTIEEPGLDELKSLNVHFEGEEGLPGRIRGTPRPLESQEPLTIELLVEVRDKADGLDRKKLQLEIDTVAIPFDHLETPLAWTNPELDLPDAWIGEGYRVRPGVSGGIEPYEYVYTGTLPKGLRYEDDLITGTVDKRETEHSYEIRVSVTDQQNQFVPEDLIEEPELKKKFILRVRHPGITLVDVVSGSGRSGRTILGAVVAQGGRDGKEWHWTGKLPPGLDSEAATNQFRETGVLTGRLSVNATPRLEPVPYPFTVWVEDRKGMESDRIECRITALPPMHLKASGK